MSRSDTVLCQTPSATCILTPLKEAVKVEFYTFVGLPQGYVFSLILFIIFLQDIFRDISCLKVKFAGDGRFLVTGTDPTYLSNIIQENLHKLRLSTLKCRMNISIEKTEICLFTRSNLEVDSSSLKVQLNDKDMPYNPNPKILGYRLDESLTVQNHIKAEQEANDTGPRSAVGNVSGYRCVSDCRSRGRKFDPSPVPFFRGD